MEAKFVVYEGPAGTFYYHLVTSGGVVMLTSKNYSSKASVFKAVETVRTHAVEAVLVDKTAVVAQAHVRSTKPSPPIQRAAAKASRPIKRAAARRAR